MAHKIDRNSPSTSSSSDVSEQSDTYQIGKELSGEVITLDGSAVLARYLITGLIDSGDYGAVYSATDAATHDLKRIAVALKVEKAADGQRSVTPNEVECLRALEPENPAVPKMFGYNLTKPPYFIAMERLHKSLHQIRNDCPSSMKKRFSLSTVIRSGKQLLEGLRRMHIKGYVHRDLKPSNIMIGFHEKGRQLFIVDYGLCRKFKDENNQLLPPRPNAHFIGSNRYLPPNCHFGLELGPSDDLMSLLFILIEMRCGELPWSSLENSVEISDLKTSMTVAGLCYGMPEKFAEFGEIIKNLRYADEVPYGKLEKLLDDTIREYRISFTELFDWENDFAVVQEEDKRMLKKGSGSGNDFRT